LELLLPALVLVDEAQDALLQQDLDLLLRQLLAATLLLVLEGAAHEDRLVQPQLPL